MILSLRIAGSLFLICAVWFLETDASTRKVPNQFPTIQQAISAASNGDVILVSPGTYTENITFLGKAVTVMSKKGARKTIDGNQVSPVVSFTSGEGLDAVLNGFTIRNGLGVGGGLANRAGGGIRIIGASPTVMNCVIKQNHGGDGIGIYILDGSPTVQGNTISEDILDGSGFNGGGGILVQSSGRLAPQAPIAAPHILNNTITGNLHFEGGGIKSDGSNPMIIGNTISNNQATIGAGIDVLGGSALIQNNVIDGNAINTSGSGGLGAGIALHDQAQGQILDNKVTNNVAAREALGAGICGFGCRDVTIMNNIVSGNRSDSEGGGIEVDTTIGTAVIVQNLVVGNIANLQDTGLGGGGGIFLSCRDAVLISNTVADNQAMSGSAIYADFLDQILLENNILIGKGPVSTLFCSGAFTPVSPLAIRFNDVFSATGTLYGQISDQTGMNGNISRDPGFLDPVNGNYRLANGSPCVDAGDDSAVDLPATDLDGKPRINRDGDGVEHVDLGAYEQ